jgi:hypothetical protein
LVQTDLAFALRGPIENIDFSAGSAGSFEYDDSKISFTEKEHS